MLAACVVSPNAWQSLGAVKYGATESETGALLSRRSLYITKDMKAGDIFTKDNLRKIRPGHGLAPKHYASCLGKRVKRDVDRGTPLAQDLIF